MPCWQQSWMNCAALTEPLVVIGPLLPMSADRLALDLGPAADRLLVEQALELEEVRAVDQPGDHLAHVVGILVRWRHHAAQLVDVVERLA